MRALLLGLLLCLPTVLPAQTAPPQVSEIAIGAPMTVWALDLREHYKDKETVLCAYGPVSGDTAYVGFLRPTSINSASATLVSYERCGMPNALLFGALRYLGTLHNHSGDTLQNGGCYFSATDDKSFNEDNDALIDLVICAKGIWARTKKDMK